MRRRRLFRVTGLFESDESYVLIPGATPPTVPMKKKDIPAPHKADKGRDRRG